MTSYGDFQSIFQLVAGLTLGVSGVLTLFEDPIEQESRRFTRLSKRLRRLPERHIYLDPDIRSNIEGALEEVDDKQESLSIESESEDRFKLTKIISFLVSAIGLWLLIYSSNRSSESIPLSIRVISFVLLAYVPLSILLVAWTFHSIGLPFRSARRSFEKRYFDIVIAIRERRRVLPNESNRMGAN